jgi:hydrogenase maturation protease
VRLRDRVTMRVLIGGTGYRFQRDASFGLHVSDALAELEWPEGVEVQDLGYGALHVAQDIAAAAPPFDRVVLISAAVRDREPGLYPGSPCEPLPDDDEIQARVREAGGGVIDLDHLLVVGRYFGAFPGDLHVLELEPLDLEGGEGLSAHAEALLPEAIARVRAAALGSPAKQPT